MCAMCTYCSVHMYPWDLSCNGGWHLLEVGTHIASPVTLSAIVVCSGCPEFKM
jgi:hypothetical protein